MSNQHNPTLLSQLYNSTIRSIWEYSCICIISAANCHLNKLQLLQNEALRIILRVPAYMPIARMNDSGNQKNVIYHLRTTARARVEQFLAKSTLVKKTVDQFKNLKSDGFNISPLDKIELWWNQDLSWIKSWRSCRKNSSKFCGNKREEKPEQQKMKN